MLSIRIAFQKLASSPLMASGTWCRGLHLVPLVGVRMTNSKRPSASQESRTFGLRLYPRDKPEDLARDESEEPPWDERYDAANRQLQFAACNRPSSDVDNAHFACVKWAMSTYLGQIC
jgi:hypothetical protein